MNDAQSEEQNTRYEHDKLKGKLGANLHGLLVLPALGRFVENLLFVFTQYVSRFKAGMQQFFGETFVYFFA